MTGPDLYAVLGVARDAMTVDIRAAYRRRAKTCHPDAGGGAEEFARLKHAYDVLLDPARRARYDATGEAPEIMADRGAEIRAMAAGALFAVINNPKLDHRRIDLVKAARDGVSGRIAELKTHRLRGEQHAKRLADIADRINAGRNENLLRAMLGAEQDKVARQLAEIAAETELLGEVEEMLGDYSYRVDITEWPQATMSFGGVLNNFGA